MTIGKAMFHKSGVDCSHAGSSHFFTVKNGYGSKPWIEENIGDGNGNYWRILGKRGSRKQILTQNFGGALIKIFLTQ